MSGQNLDLVGDNSSPIRNDPWNRAVAITHIKRLSGSGSLDLLNLYFRWNIRSGVIGILPGVGSARLPCPFTTWFIRYLFKMFMCKPISLCRELTLEMY